MRRVKVSVAGVPCGILTEHNTTEYRFDYQADYDGPPVSLTMPVQQQHYAFNTFPPVFDGLLPEGMMLSALLRKAKLDQHDYMGQLIQVGSDCIGAITLEECQDV